MAPKAGRNLVAGDGLIAADKELKEYSAAVAERRSGEQAAEQVPVQEKAPVKEEKQAPEQNTEKQVASQMKKFDKDVQKFRELSRKLLHDPAVDAGAFGLNSWELQAAKMVAIAGVQNGLEQGMLQPNEIDQEIRKNVRRIGNSQEFKDWAKDVQKDHEKMKQISKMAPEEVRMDFVTGMSKNMEKQNDGLKKEVMNKDGVKKNAEKKTVFR